MCDACKVSGLRLSYSRSEQDWQWAITGAVVKGSFALGAVVGKKASSLAVSFIKARIPGSPAVMFGENIAGINVTFSNNSRSASQYVCLVLTVTNPVK